MAIRLIFQTRDGATSFRTVHGWRAALKYLPTNGHVSIAVGAYATLAVITVQQR